jgi:hypothetical protein
VKYFVAFLSAHQHEPNGYIATEPNCGYGRYMGRSWRIIQLMPNRSRS